MGDRTNDELATLLGHFARGLSADRKIEAAQRAFHEATRRPLERMISQALMHRPDLVRAAVQEAWSQIFLSAARYDSEAGTVVAWMKGIGLNCARRVLRQESMATRLVVTAKMPARGDDDGVDGAPDLNELVACPAPGPEQLTHALQIRRAIGTCLERLPADGRVPYRQAYELALDSDLTNKDLAEFFNARHPDRDPCNEEQLRKWVARASARMRQCIGALLQVRSLA